MEPLYRDDLQKYSVDVLIPLFREYFNKSKLFWGTVHSCSMLDLKFIFLYQIIGPGKYHKAYLISILLAGVFFITMGAQLLLQGERPLWIL
jgi:hypothetical protein